MSKLYEIGDKFIIRMPIMPMNILNKFIINNNELYEELYEELKGNKVFMESIRVSSQNLYDSIVKKNFKQLEKEKISIIKYLIRMSMRTTPYGLFAGIGYGEISSENNIEVNEIAKFKKYVQPDMEWICKYLCYIQKKYISQIMVRKNNTLVKRGHKLENYNYVSLDEEKYKKDGMWSVVKVDFSKPLEIILNNSEKWISVENLLKIVKSNYNHVEDSVIMNYIVGLIDNSILLSNLNPPLVNCDVLDYIIQELIKINIENEEIKKISNIKEKILFYNNKKIGLGIDQYNEIINCMSDIIEADNYLKIDLKTSYQNLSLNRDDLQVLEEFVNFSVDIMSNTTNRYSKYIETFNSRYGFTEVPLIEVINSNEGIGFPKEQYVNNSILEKYIMDKYGEVVFKEDKYIDLYSDEFKESIKKNKELNKKTEQYIDSLELAVNIRKNSGNYEFYLSPLAGSDMIGKISGRFGYMFNEEEYQSYLLNRGNKNSDYITVEVSFPPKQKRVSNVLLCKSNADYELRFSNNSTLEEIDINDIIVGLDRNGLYFKSVKYDKRIKFIISNMVNTEHASQVIKMLLNLSDYKKINPLKLFNSIDFKKFSYFPQIRYKNLVLTSTLWNVDRFNLGIKNKKLDINQFKLIIMNWKEKMNIPEIVYLAESDNRLVLSFKNKECIEILYQAIVINDKRVKLTEIDFGFNENLVRNRENEFYYSEYIIPIRNNISDNTVRTNKNIVVRKNSNMRYINPYKEWGYYKLYHYDGVADELLLNYLEPFFSSLVEEKLIDKYFFIRYADPKRHIRVRFKVANSVSRLRILDLIDGLIINLNKVNLVYNTCIDTYERELERYGGEICIEAAENLFCSDSICSLELLKLFNDKIVRIKKDYIAVISIIRYLDDLGYSFESQLEIFDRIVDKNDYRKEFQKERASLIKIANNNENWKGLRNIDGGEKILLILESRSKFVEEYNKKIYYALGKKLLFSNKEDITYSLIHMFCNRFLGGKREDEKRVNAFVRHTLYSLRYFKMVKKNEE